jgi:hypothetical protein
MFALPVDRSPCEEDILDYAWWAPFRRLEISFSQGPEWKALINAYIQTISFSGDASCAVEQSMSARPLPRTPVSKAMIANVGAAASKSQPAASSAATLLPPPLARTVSPCVAAPEPVQSAGDSPLSVPLWLD